MERIHWHGDKAKKPPHISSLIRLDLTLSFSANKHIKHDAQKTLVAKYINH